MVVFVNVTVLFENLDVSLSPQVNIKVFASRTTFLSWYLHTRVFKTDFVGSLIYGSQKKT